MSHPHKRIVGNEAMNVRPALEVYFLSRRRPRVPVWAQILIMMVVLIIGAWIDAVIEVPVFGAIFVFIGWRLWRAA